MTTIASAARAEEYDLASPRVSMPASQPRLDDLLRAIDYWTQVGYPARGDA